MPIVLAFDLGASSGRGFLGELSSGILTIREVRRFANEPVQQGTSSHWDVQRIWTEIRETLSGLAGTRLEGIGVDTWGVDYALLGERGDLLQNPLHYREPRNVQAMQEVLQRVSKQEIYRQTGIQFMPINTLNQLFAAQRDTPQLLAAARRLVLMPDLFHYWLSGNAVCEFSAASTTQFANPITRDWARDLLTRLSLPADLPAQIVEPGALVGRLQASVGTASLTGTPVIAPASHDTASAVAAISARGSTAFLSSGTWSLIGTELDAPNISEQSLRKNFTNEGGVSGTTRFLKNVMGLWMLQGCRRVWSTENRQEYGELIDSARQAPPFAHLVDPDDPSFLNPRDMTTALDDFCRKTDQANPATPAAYTRAVLESLALKYRLVLRDLESLTGQAIEHLRVIGGGSQNRLLNQFTADATGKQVIAGPVEATALGNVGVQLLATGAVSSLKEVRALIDRSFPTEIFEPQDTARWNSQAQRFEQYCEFSYV